MCALLDKDGYLNVKVKVNIINCFKMLSYTIILNSQNKKLKSMVKKTG